MSSFWTSNAPALIALGGVLAGLVAGFFQWRGNLRQQRGLEERKQELERRKLELDQEKFAWDRAKAEHERGTAEEEFQERLRDAREHADAVERGALDYRAAVVASLRHLKILDMPQPLDLESLYVQVRVREEEPRRYLHPEEARRLARGGEEQLLEGTGQTFAPEEAMARHARMTVVGDPGAGKTTMLKYLTFRIARGELRPGPTLPVFVELRRFVDSGEERLLDFAVKQLDERYGFRDAGPYLRGRLETGQAALLLDGLDEVLGGATPEEAERAYTHVAEEISRLAGRYRLAPIVVTCRKAGWRGGLQEFGSLEVLDFTWEQVEAFAANWFAEDPVKAEGLRAALSGNSRMRALAANPLLLSLIAIVYGKDLELPERRAELYNRCVDVMLKEWDAHRGIRRQSEFTTARKRDLLEEIAWHFHQHGWRYLPEHELLDVIARFLPTVDLPAERAAEVLAEICAQYGLLKEMAHGWYGFLHLTLQDYFAAVAANEHGQAAIARIVGHRHDPWWEEVITLLAGRMTDASPLLLAILGRQTSDEPPRGHPVAADDDLFHGDLMLAGSCLVGTPRIKVPWLRRRIVDDMFGVLMDETLPKSMQRTCARRLVEISGDEITERLLGYVTDPGHSRGGRERAIEALGNSRAKNLGARLLALAPGFDLEENLALALGHLRCREAEPYLLGELRQRLAHGLAPGGAFVVALSGLGGHGVVRLLVESLVNDTGSPVDPYLFPPYRRLPIGADVATLALEALEGGRVEATKRDIAGYIAAAGLGPKVAARIFALGFGRTGYVTVEAYKAVMDGAAAELALDLVRGGTRAGSDAVELIAALEVVAARSLPVLSALLREGGLDRFGRLELIHGLAWWTDAATVPELCGLFADLLAGEEADEVKLPLARSLARWKSTEGVPVLRKAFADAKDNLDALAEIAEALHGVGDTSVVAPLHARLTEAIGHGDRHEVERVLRLLKPYAPSEVTGLVLDNLSLWDGEFSLVLADYLDRGIPDELIGKAVQVTAGSWNPWLMLEVLSESRARPGHVERFLRVEIPERIRYRTSRMDALFAMSRTAKVRVFADGRVVPVRREFSDA
ncbi:NACHT domain-containing protein [Nonomuraea endophytica]|uniref:NACHT domain-containing protein n=1 Tax=Nonomuraea endophytica TaxID=714136 RepID=A0A7W8A2H1_9ACTN|nr:NACHT domain-containing protein [Nonomuraea endophytica]MBB5077660.1 hypothetical protein [Nonomuraea endophytica]